MDFTNYLEIVEKEKSRKIKMDTISVGMVRDKNLEDYFRMTFDDIVLNVSDKLIEKALNIQSHMKYRDIGEKVCKHLSITKQSCSLLSFTNGEEKAEFVTFDEFKSFKLNLEHSRGNETQIILKDFLNRCTPVQAKWFCRCIVKDLACGMSLISINRVFENLEKKLIETFDLALCSTINCDSEKQMKKELDIISNENKNLWTEHKYDGIRLVIKNCLGGRPRKTNAFSRNGKTIESVPFLIREFDRIFKKRLVELDGELIAKDFQSLMTQVHRKNDFNITMPREYRVFDILTLDGNDLTYLSYNDRREIMETLFDTIDSKIIKLVKSHKMSKPEEIIELFHKSVDAGYEGVVVKNNAPYTRDRENWWKMKPTNSAEMFIMEGIRAISGRHVGKVNAIMVKDASGTVVSRVGSGITDEDVEQMTMLEEKGELAGKLVEIKYDSITHANADNIRSLRFPRFIGYRPDKSEADNL